MKTSDWLVVCAVATLLTVAVYGIYSARSRVLKVEETCTKTTMIIINHSGRAVPVYDCSKLQK